MAIHLTIGVASVIKAAHFSCDGNHMEAGYPENSVLHQAFRHTHSAAGLADIGGMLQALSI